MANLANKMLQIDIQYLELDIMSLVTNTPITNKCNDIAFKDSTFVE